MIGCPMSRSPRQGRSPQPGGCECKDLYVGEGCNVVKTYIAHFTVQFGTLYICLRPRSN